MAEPHLNAVADLQGMLGMHRHTLQFQQLQIYAYVFMWKNIHVHVCAAYPDLFQRWDARG
jgi:hypothetical protein